MIYLYTDFSVDRSSGFSFTARTVIHTDATHQPSTPRLLLTTMCVITTINTTQADDLTVNCLVLDLFLCVFYPRHLSRIGL